MTDQELDLLMRRVLIDAIKADVDAAPKTEIPFRASGQYRRSMRRMCKDPVKWLREREMPVWKRALKQVAAILLVISIGAGILIAAVPSVRAAVVNWFIEWYETYIVYRYEEEATSEQLPEYGITALPDGFVETKRTTMPQLALVIYSDEADDLILLRYEFMYQGGNSTAYIDDSNTKSIMVNGMHGVFIKAEISDEFNTVTWIDESRNIQFSISGSFGLSELIQMAESIS